MEKNFNMNIPAEKFRLVHDGDRIHDKKFDDKPVGYFKDAWIRFRKSHAAVVATIIIIAIVLYAFVAPLLITTHDGGFMVSYYSKKPGRVTWLRDTIGIMDGGVERENINEAELVRLTAIGIGAADWDGHGATLAEGRENYYSPILECGDPEVVLNAKKQEVNQYDVRVDAYLEVGFIYASIKQEELQDILEWQEETGLQVLYPLVATNEYNPDPNNANNWYKAQKVGYPVAVNSMGETFKMSYSEKMQLQDNYMRDADGNLMYYAYTGGGSTETAQYKIRVL